MNLISTESLLALSNLQITAKKIVDSLLIGKHSTRQKGQSLNFADHRQYTYGDDLKHLDWKVLGRSDKLVIKRYDSENDLGCTIAIDGSASMFYKSDKSDFNKFHYSSILAATLSLLVINQHDRAGLLLFDEQENFYIAPGRKQIFQKICSSLENYKNKQKKTDLQKSLQTLITPKNKRGLIIVITDLLCDDFEETINKLQKKGHTVVFIWVLDPEEEKLSIDTVSKFVGVEENEEINIDTRAIRESYKEIVAKEKEKNKSIAIKKGVKLINALTTDSPTVVLHQLLRNQ